MCQMTDIVIQNYDRASEVLLYSTETGPVEEKALPVNVKRDRGFYISHDDHYYGVFASEYGPVVFRGAQQWQLQRGDATAHIDVLLDGRRHMTLRTRNGVAFDVTYYADHPLVDWSEDEETIDFFGWLHTSIEKDSQNFFPFYMRKI
jgi:hypothetical protein